MKNAICSIVSNNYFSQVLNLCKSIRKIYDKEIEIYVLIVDKKSDQVDYSESDAHILFAHELGIENFLYYALKYNVIEFNTFLKPFLLEKLLDKHEKVVYLDPDIEIFDKLDIIYDSLENKDFSVSPHKIDMFTLFDENERNILLGGYFNLGFCAVKNSTFGKLILKMWQEDLKINCYSDIAVHQFTDQKSIANLYYKFYNYIEVINHPGVNFAPWNFCERELINKENKLFVKLKSAQEDKPLIFFHYSGFNVNGGQVYFTTKHLDMDLSRQTDLIAVLDSYRERINLNHYGDYSKIKYCYNFFSNNFYVSRFERRIFEYLVSCGKLDKSIDYFNADNQFYKLLKKNHLLTSDKLMSVDLISLNALSKGDFSKKERTVKKLMKIAKKLLGIDNYIMLMKYLTHASRMNNQTFLLKKLDI